MAAPAFGIPITGSVEVREVSHDNTTWQQLCSHIMQPHHQGAKAKAANANGKAKAANANGKAKAANANSAAASANGCNNKRDIDVRHHQGGGKNKAAPAAAAGTNANANVAANACDDAAN
jgi:hypothetical protein